MLVGELKKLLETVPDDAVVAAGDYFGNALLYEPSNFYVPKEPRRAAKFGWDKPYGPPVRVFLIEQLDRGPEPD